MLRFENIIKRYGGTVALDGLDLEVRDNEILALLGPTGAGKTSTLLCASGLEGVDGGRITADGTDITGQSAAERDVAMVFEGFNLLPTLSVGDNIAFSLRSPAFRESEDEVARRVANVAASLRIDHLLERDVETLSGGERQRVAIARAIVRRPKLYLLDEPLSALDLKLREGLRIELRQLHRDHPATMLYATHDYHGAAAIADRVAIIEAGRIYQIGALNDLFDDPAHAVVGRHLGSPGMIQLEGRLRDDRVVLDGSDHSVPVGALDESFNDGHRVLLGLWPDDLEIAPAAAGNYHPATIYAVEFRGIDKAIQIDAGHHALRKVVDVDLRADQGDKIWFRIPPACCFLFDAATGRRLRQRSVV